MPQNHDASLLGPKSNRILLSLLAGSSVALIGAAFDIVVEAMRVPSLMGHGLDFCLLLTFWTASFWVIFAQIHRRQEAVRKQQQQVAELNHHIRNALAVVLLAQGLPPERAAMVKDAIERIDQTLRQVVPMSPVETSAATSARIPGHDSARLS
jgi:hypothetical protein